MISDFAELLRVFNRSGVKYLLIGGHAVMHYTEPRYTKDLDLWVEASPQNSVSVVEALRIFGAPLVRRATWKIDSGGFAEVGYFYSMGVPPARVDIMMSISGVSFEQAWERRETTLFEGVETPVISKADLIAAKKSAGRARDLADLESLETGY
ncbi:MAG: nucleotidyltransferase [Bryobacteraceae bacterium]|nr:nucleotidyltransferase [Bryobacteraceae bacterium]